MGGADDRLVWDTPRAAAQVRYDLRERWRQEDMRAEDDDQ